MFNGVGGSDDRSMSSEMNDGMRAPYAASMSVNDSDAADCSESWLNIESVGDSAAEGSLGESGEMGDAGLEGRGGMVSSVPSGRRRVKWS